MNRTNILPIKKNRPPLLLPLLMIIFAILTACGTKEAALPSEASAGSGGAISPAVSETPAPAQSQAPPSAAPAAASPEASPPPSASPAGEPKAQNADPSHAAASPSSSPADTSSGKAGQVYTVEIKDFAFSPAKLDIRAGDRIKFINRDGVKHSALADDGSFDTGLLGKDEAKEIAFAKEGEFSYYCKPHPGMKATVTVKAP